MPKPPTRLLVVVNVYRPDLGGGILFSDLCEGLAARGFDVTVKCAYSYYPEWKDKSSRNGWKIRSTVDAGVTVERHGLYVPGNPNSLLQRLVYEASFYLSLRRRLPKRNSLDAILVICPLVGSVAYAAAAKRKSGAPLWLNVQDLSAQAAAAGGITNSRVVSRIMVRIQSYLFSKASVWSSISPSMVEVLKSLGPKGKPVELIPNWLHRSLANHIEEIHDQEERQRSGTVRLLYSGNIGGKQDLLPFCQHLHGTEIDFRLRIQGDGARAPELQTWLNQVDDSRFELVGLTDEAGLASALHEADFYVITERPGVGSAFIPSKLIPGMKAGTPILAVCDLDSPLGQEVSEYSLGPQVDWTNLGALESVFDLDGESQDEYLVWKANTKARSVFYTREQGISRCADLIERMIDEYKKGKD